jgi:hypothetical protein
MLGNNSNWRSNQFRKEPSSNKAKQKHHQVDSREHPKPMKVAISRDIIRGIEEILYQHKVVILFDGRVTSTQAGEWITAYNEEHLSHSLS